MKSLAAVENALKLPNTARVINSSSSAQKPSTAGTGTAATKRKNYHNKKTLLHWAVLREGKENETINLVKQLISKGAEIDVRDKVKKTPLQYVSTMGYNSLGLNPWLLYLCFELFS